MRRSQRSIYFHALPFVTCKRKPKIIHSARNPDGDQAKFSASVKQPVNTIYNQASGTEVLAVP